MDINVRASSDITLKGTLDTIQSLLSSLRTMRREEEHRLTIAEGVYTSALLAASLAAIVEQKRREGYLITVPQKLARVASLIELDQERVQVETLITQLDMRADVRNSVLYMVGELIDNIREHAHTPFGVVAVLSNAAHISMAVVDTGISIPAAYREAAIGIKDDCEAITKALAGISTKTVEERGTGLPSVKRLAIEGFGGELAILSAGAAFFGSPFSTDCKARPTYWQGTAVSLTLPIHSQAIDFYKYVR